MLSEPIGWSHYMSINGWYLYTLNYIIYVIWVVAANCRPLAKNAILLKWWSRNLSFYMTRPHVQQHFGRSTRGKTTPTFSKARYLWFWESIFLWWFWTSTIYLWFWQTLGFIVLDLTFQYVFPSGTGPGWGLSPSRRSRSGWRPPVDRPPFRPWRRGMASGDLWAMVHLSFQESYAASCAGEWWAVYGDLPWWILGDDQP